MAHPQIAAFARLADGGAAPARVVAGQATKLGRTMHAIAYDEINDEFFVPQQFGQAILAFRGGASGEEAPLRVIQGPKTGLVAPDRLAVDAVHDEIFVPMDDAVLVFARGAHGDVAPIRVLRGPGRSLGAEVVAVDPVHNLLIVGGRADGKSRVQVFDRTAAGNAEPRSVITGPKTELGLSVGLMAVYPPKGLLFVSMRGAQGEIESANQYVAVWSIHDGGDVAPRVRIGGPIGLLKQIRGVALDVKNKSVIVSDKRLNGILTFFVPEIF